MAQCLMAALGRALQCAVDKQCPQVVVTGSVASHASPLKESGCHDMVCGHRATVTDTWRAAPTARATAGRRAIPGRAVWVKRSAGWQDVTDMATQAPPALADFDPTTERARTAWMAA